MTFFKLIIISFICHGDYFNKNEYQNRIKTLNKKISISNQKSKFSQDVLNQNLIKISRLKGDLILNLSMFSDLEILNIFNDESMDAGFIYFNDIYKDYKNLHKSLNKNKAIVNNLNTYKKKIAHEKKILLKLLEDNIKNFKFKKKSTLSKVYRKPVEGNITLKYGLYKDSNVWLNNLGVVFSNTKNKNVVMPNRGKIIYVGIIGDKKSLIIQHDEGVHSVLIGDITKYKIDNFLDKGEYVGKVSTNSLEHQLRVQKYPINPEYLYE